MGERRTAHVLATCTADLGGVTYAASLACSNVVWKALDVVWVAHENGGLHSRECVAGQSTASAATERVVHDLSTLLSISIAHGTKGTY